jgi:predicted DNA-binding WGR domain protein
MSGEQFYINYSLNGEHYAMGPYHTRRFAMSQAATRRFQCLSRQQATRG